jgi:glycine/D-amino acid oxidase-like deaminating enzyme
MTVPTPPGRSTSSLWADTLPTDEAATGSAEVVDGADVLIVGAGFTGLWTAWHLRRIDPTLRIVVVEREHVGFGASGRNGGWCSALLPMGLHRTAARHGEPAARRMRLAMQQTVVDIGQFAAEHAPAGAFHRGGTIDLARSAPQVDRLRAELDELRHFGFGEDDARWVDADEAASICAADGVVGGVLTPHCAAVHPLRLVHALARAVTAAGVPVVEGVDVREIAPGRAVTDRGTVRAEIVVRATEGYTPQLAGERRTVLPIYSLMIATEPLPDATWDEIGLADRPTFADGRHLIIYGQRTADGRFAFGGRGAPYHFGSAIDPRFDTDDRICEHLVRELWELFPQLGGAAVTHHWGGVLAAPRDWTCSVRFDRATGLAEAGGYVGDGVAATHLAGRTLAALVTGAGDDEDGELVRLPWVGHRSRRWEPEPARWIGVNAARWAARRADEVERRTGRSSRLWGGAVDRILGR